MPAIDGEVHDRASFTRILALILHDARGGAADDERAGHVDVEHLAELLHSRIERRPVEADAGRIDYAVEAAKRLHDVFHGGFGGRLIGHVEHAGAQRFVLVGIGKPLERTLVAVESADTPARVKQALDGCKSDARRAAGYNRSASRLRIRHGPFPRYLITQRPLPSARHLPMMRTKGRV